MSTVGSGDAIVDLYDSLFHNIIVRIESLWSEAESRAGKKQIFNVSIEVKFINSSGRS